MRIAVSTALGCDVGLEVALARIVATGCRNVDVLTIDGWVHVLPSRLLEDFEGECVSFRDALQARGLHVIATNSGMGVALWDRSPDACRVRQERLRALLGFLGRFGIGFAAIQPLQPDRARANWEETLADCSETLVEHITEGAKAGVRMGLELHVHSPFETLDQARRLLEVLPNVPLVLDPTHFVMQGLPLEELRWLIPHAVHVHLRDAAPDRLQTPYGEGEVDFDWLLDALLESGYSGDFSIEYLGTQEFDVVASAGRLFEHVAKRLGQQA